MECRSPSLHTEAPSSQQMGGKKRKKQTPAQGKQLWRQPEQKRFTEIKLISRDEEVNE